jgi:hypothetical protein
VGGRACGTPAATRVAGAVWEWLAYPDLAAAGAPATCSWLLTLALALQHHWTVDWQPQQPPHAAIGKHERTAAVLAPQLAEGMAAAGAAAAAVRAAAWEQRRVAPGQLVAARGCRPQQVGPPAAGARESRRLLAQPTTPAAAASLQPCCLRRCQGCERAQRPCRTAVTAETLQQGWQGCRLTAAAAGQSILALPLRNCWAEQPKAGCLH